VHPSCNSALTTLLNATLLLQGKKKKSAAIELNIGGELLVCSRDTLKQAAPQSLLSFIESCRYDKRLKYDADGHIFFDLDKKWVAPIFSYLTQLAQSANAALVQPTSLFIDDDDLTGFYAAVDFFGLSSLFGIADSGTPDLIDQQQFVKEMTLVDAPELKWSYPWQSVYKATRDGFDRKSYQAKVAGVANTLYVIRDTGDSVFGSFSAVARTFSDTKGAHKWVRTTEDPHSFGFSAAQKGMSKHYKFSVRPGGCTGVNNWQNFGCGENDLLYRFNHGKTGHNGDSKFNHYVNDHSTWTWPGLSETEIFVAQEIEVWQIPSTAAVAAVTDTLAAAAAVAAAACTISAKHSDTCSMQFRDDMAVFSQPVTQLGNEFQLWLNAYLQQLDARTEALKAATDTLDAEVAFMNYHYPDKPEQVHAREQQLKGLHDGIVHIQLTEHTVLTTQSTLQQFEDSKLDVKYASGRWTADNWTLTTKGYCFEEHDYCCFKKLVNVMRIKALMKAPMCTLNEQWKQRCPKAVPANRKQQMSSMLAQLLIPEETFYAQFAA
jgi:hypothetical protein